MDRIARTRLTSRNGRNGSSSTFLRLVFVLVAVGVFASLVFLQSTSSSEVEEIEKERNAATLPLIVKTLGNIAPHPELASTRPPKPAPPPPKPSPSPPRPTPSPPKPTPLPPKPTPTPTHKKENGEAKIEENVEQKIAGRTPDIETMDQLLAQEEFVLSEKAFVFTVFFWLHRDNFALGSYRALESIFYHHPNAQLDLLVFSPPPQTYGWDGRHRHQSLKTVEKYERLGFTANTVTPGKIGRVANGAEGKVYADLLWLEGIAKQETYLGAVERHLKLFFCILSLHLRGGVYTDGTFLFTRPLDELVEAEWKGRSVIATTPKCPNSGPDAYVSDAFLGRGGGEKIFDRQAVDLLNSEFVYLHKTSHPVTKLAMKQFDLSVEGSRRGKVKRCQEHTEDLFCVFVPDVTVGELLHWCSARLDGEFGKLIDISDDVASALDCDNRHSTSNRTRVAVETAVGSSTIPGVSIVSAGAVRRRWDPPSSGSAVDFLYRSFSFQEGSRVQKLGRFEGFFVNNMLELDLPELGPNADTPLCHHYIAGDKGTQNHGRAKCTPSFFVPGCMKCGSSNMFHSIALHPQVLHPLDGSVQFKEVNFFQNPKRLVDPNIYLASMPFIEPHDNFIVGDGTIWYLLTRDAPKAITKWNPNSKFVVVLRDPVERAISHYDMLKKEDKLVNHLKVFLTAMGELTDLKPSSPNSEFFRLPPHELRYWREGLYLFQVKNLLDSFPRDQVKFVQSEYFREHSVKVMEETIEFLGLAKIDVDAMLHSGPKAVVNKGRGYKGEFPVDMLKLAYEFYKPFNEALYELIGVDYDWEGAFERSHQVKLDDWKPLKKKFELSSDRENDLKLLTQKLSRHSQAGAKHKKK